MNACSVGLVGSSASPRRPSVAVASCCSLPPLRRARSRFSFLVRPRLRSLPSSWSPPELRSFVVRVLGLRSPFVSVRGRSVVGPRSVRGLSSLRFRIAPGTPERVGCGVCPLPLPRRVPILSLRPLARAFVYAFVGRLARSLVGPARIFGSLARQFGLFGAPSRHDFPPCQASAWGGSWSW